MKGSSRSRLESIYLSVRDEEVKENSIENEPVMVVKKTRRIPRLAPRNGSSLCFLIALLNLPLVRSERTKKNARAVDVISP